MNMKNYIRAYRYTYGDGSEYWDCYQVNVGFIGRCHSMIELANLALTKDTVFTEVL